jgi:hypothetical protein
MRFDGARAEVAATAELDQIAQGQRTQIDDQPGVAKLWKRLIVLCAELRAPVDVDVVVDVELRVRLVGYGYELLRCGTRRACSASRFPAAV